MWVKSSGRTSCFLVLLLQLLLLLNLFLLFLSIDFCSSDVYVCVGGCGWVKVFFCKLQAMLTRSAFHVSHVGVHVFSAQPDEKFCEHALPMLCCLCTTRRKGGASTPAAVGTDRSKDASARFPIAPTHPMDKSRNRATSYNTSAAVSLGTGHPSHVTGPFGSSGVEDGKVASRGEKSQPHTDQACVGPLPGSQEGILVPEPSGRRATLCRLPNAGAEDRLSPTPDGG